MGPVALCHDQHFLLSLVLCPLNTQPSFPPSPICPPCHDLSQLSMVPGNLSGVTLPGEIVNTKRRVLANSLIFQRKVSIYQK